MSNGQVRTPVPQADVAHELSVKIQKMLDQQRDIWSVVVESLSERRETSQSIDANEYDDTRRMLDKIKSKEFCSASEAAMLLGCSAQHLRNKVEQAIDGHTEYPIPHANLDGPVVFPVGELLAWARQPKTKAKKGGASSKNKTHLRAVGAANSLP